MVALKPVETSDAVIESLILDLLEWIGPIPRPYDEVIEAWRTSCPRLPVWEEANDRGFVVRAAGKCRSVAVSASGRAHLQKYRFAPAVPLN
jgi:D-3-phosphoglycerate dehydrogenase